MTVLKLYLAVTLITTQYFLSVVLIFPNLKANLFRRTNENLHNIVNKLFGSFKVNRNFKQSDINQLLSTIHKNGNNKAEEIYEAYGEIQNMVKAKNKNEMKIISDIDEVVNAFVFEKEHYSFLNDMVETGFHDVIMNEDSENIPISQKFMKGFAKIMNKLKLENLIDYNHMLINDPSVSKKNLKVWFDTNQTVNTRRIFKGKKTTIRDYPFMASVHVQNKFMCSGCIISNDLVITAASCLSLMYDNKLDRQDPNAIFIRVGSDDVSTGERIPVTKVYLHPMYDPTTLKNNLALLRIDKHMSLKKKNTRIRRIQFDTYANEMPSNVNKVVVLGWGSKTKDQRFVNTKESLSYGILNVYNIKQCQEIYTRKYVNNENFCAGFVNKGDGACTRDIGGPGLINSTLVGVINFGPPTCGAWDTPTVFTKLGYYTEWIENIMKEKSAETKTKDLQSQSLKFKDIIDAQLNQIYLKISNETKVLDSLFEDLALRFNIDDVDDFLYGDGDHTEHFDVFATNKPIKIEDHPLANQSIFLLPELMPLSTEEEHDMIILTTSTTPDPLYYKYVVNEPDIPELVTASNLPGWSKFYGRKQNMDLQE